MSGDNLDVSTKETAKLLLEVAAVSSSPLNFASILYDDPSEERIQTTDYQKQLSSQTKNLQCVSRLATKFGLVNQLQKLVCSSFPSHWGSAPNYKPLAYYYCANSVTGRKYCENEGKLRCSGCYLVAYCSKDCQRQHWSRHREDCKSNFASDTWQPDFVNEGRLPQSMFGTFNPNIMKHFVWGNIPAFDIINWQNTELQELDNQGTFCTPIKFIYTASGMNCCCTFKHFLTLVDVFIC